MALCRGVFVQSGYVIGDSREGDRGAIVGENRIGDPTSGAGRFTHTLVQLEIAPSVFFEHLFGKIQQGRKDEC
jgi:hypothetical protein